MNAEVLDHAMREAGLIEQARAMMPELKRRARAAEAARMLQTETIDDFRKAGFFKILQSPAYGGFGLSPLTLCRVVFEVGRGDMSAGWVLFVLALHQYEVTLMGEAACETIWGENPDALVASSVAPFGALERVEGGFRLNGRWRFSSGIDHSDWVGVGGLVANLDGKGKDFRMSLIPTKDARIDPQSWNPFGLAGTGSKDLDIDNVFVPEHLSFSLVDAHRMIGQDKLSRNFRYPFWIVFNAVLGAAIIGGANGGVDEAIEQMSVRVGSADNGNGKQAAADDHFVRMRVGRARVLVRTAQARYSAIFAEMDDYISKGEAIPVEQRMHYIAEIAQCGRDCEEAVLTLYKTTGGRGISLDNNMQAILRNVLAGANHVAMNLDPMLQNLGGQLLGGEIPPVMC
ncbi:acyl-CoA dehydrogenase family protein [Rhizobium sp. FY34]|uniref:acyl-CoA dehydrogenase family protein n=1 Tax=Rhizobium sp. FY34 TaxID=2562309 RepID=UPI0010C1011E|nr:acyl-CoA dehydrogenase family protein [Rhizobium sp. FY34]